MDVLFRGRVQILLARLVYNCLIDGLSKEALVETTQAVLLVCFINDFDEVSLFKQSDGFFHSFRIAGALCKRRDEFKGIKLELFAEDRGSLE